MASQDEEKNARKNDNPRLKIIELLKHSSAAYVDTFER
jgi:hypothetical protein